MNQKLKDVFKGKVVNKALTINAGVDEFPRYVVEYLIDNYCSEETFHADMEKVVRRLKENFVHGAEAEKIRHYIRERTVLKERRSARWFKRHWEHGTGPSVRRISGGLRMVPDREKPRKT